MPIGPGEEPSEGRKPIILVQREMPLRTPWVLHQMAHRLLERLGPDTGTTDQGIEAARAAMEAGPGKMPIWRGIEVREGRVAGVPGRWLTPRNPRPGTLVYLHGGAYTKGSSLTHTPGVALLVAKLQRPAFVVDYRLAPEHPYPAAVEDASAVVREVVSDQGSSMVVLAGDSAGGGLSVATLLSLRQSGEALPAAAWLLCPWVDLTMSRPSIVAHQAAIEGLDFNELTWSADAYAGSDPGRPGVSPLFANLSGLPPLLVQVGGADPLRDEAIELAANAAATGVDVQLEAWERTEHVFQFTFAPFPEAIAARRAGVRFLEAHLSG